MNCTTCGKALSLRMTHCSACGTPASYMLQAQPAPSNAYSSIQQSLPSPSSLQAQPLYAPIAQSTMPPRATQRRRWDNLFLLIILACVLLLFGIGAYKLIKTANAATISTHVNTPSGNALVPSASVMLKDIQASGDIDNNLAPTHITKTFMANQKVYVTFVINSGNRDGYIEARWYADGQVATSTILAHTHGNTRGVFSNVYITATPDGAVELYWCMQAGCKDAQLAQVVHFVVTPVNSVYTRLRPSDVAQHFGKLRAFLLIQWQ